MKANFDRPAAAPIGGQASTSAETTPPPSKAEAEAMRAALMAQASQHRWFKKAATGQTETTGVDALLARYYPVSYSKLAAQELALTRAETIAQAYLAMAQLLSTALDVGPKMPRPAALEAEATAREKMLGDVRAVRRMIEALGDGEATGRMPVDALGRLEDRLSTEVASMIAIRDEAIAHHKESALLPLGLDAKAAAAALGERLSAPKLGKRILDARRALKDGRSSFDHNLVAMALLVDQATTTLDYARQHMGKYADAKAGYRNRDYEPWKAYGASPRQKATQASVKVALGRALEGSKPDRAIEKLMVSTFLAEIGVRGQTGASWKPSPKAVRAALHHELVAPLRALRETVPDMAVGQFGVPPPAGLDMKKAIQRSVDAITRHVLEGDFREWRYSNAFSKAQLAMLTKAQLESWKKNQISITTVGGSGQGLKTREVDGLELFWVPKIGGPSHGFDRGGHCSLPLLSNGRTKAIVVDDDSWPGNPSARAYLRVLPDSEGRPTLYLEPAQRDFPHRDRDTDGNRDAEWDAAHRALLGHALAKAKAMNVPLSVGREYTSACAALGVDAQAQIQIFKILPSGGVREASDTLLPKDADPKRAEGHDWVNTTEQATPPLDRLWIAASGARR